MCDDMSILRPVRGWGPISVCGIIRDLPLGAVTRNQSPSVERLKKAQPCAESGTPSALLPGSSPESTQLNVPLYCEYQLPLPEFLACGSPGSKSMPLDRSQMPGSS